MLRSQNSLQIVHLAAHDGRVARSLDVLKVRRWLDESELWVVNLLLALGLSAAHIVEERSEAKIVLAVSEATFSIGELAFALLPLLADRRLSEVWCIVDCTMSERTILTMPATTLLEECAAPWSSGTENGRAVVHLSWWS